MRMVKRGIGKSGIILAKVSLLGFCMLVGMSTLCAQQSPDSWDSLALTPPMGWNSWNFFEGKISEQVVRNMADAMVSNGMKDAGYSYLVIDDLWVGGRDSRNRLFPDSSRFPHGMKALADYVHGKGLKLGIYSDAAEITCGGVTGSLGFEELDAKTFASWGIDFLKYDYCNAPEDVTTAFTRYKKMGDALKKTGRPIVYSICEWGQRKPWLWARAAGGHLWRTTWDGRDVWQSNNKDLTGIMEIYQQQKGLEGYAGPGGWNDPDLLMVGLYGKGSSSSADGRFKGGSLTEYRTQFTIWCMLAAPLMVNLDLDKMDSPTLSLLTNKFLVGIDQDSLGKQASIIYDKDDLEVLLKPLTRGQVALCVFNKSENGRHFALDLRKDLDIWKPFQVLSVWDEKKIGLTTQLKGNLGTHDCAVYILTRL
jgi:alpha-galactosidase